MVTVNKATFIWKWILLIFKGKRNVIVAMINPFTLNILALGDRQIPDRMYRHEMEHIEQVKRDGRIKFCIRYLYYNLRYGYFNNPYEKEARKVR